MNRMRMTKSKRNSRRSHHSANIPAHTEEDGTTRLRHRASRLTGIYRGRKVVSGNQSTDNKKEKQTPVSQGNSGDEKRTIEQIDAPK